MQYALGSASVIGVRRAPLGEAGTERVVLGEALAQAVEALGDGLAVGAGQRLGAEVDLDAGDDALALEQLHQRRAVGGVLADGLVEEDDAADVVADVLRGEQHLAVVAPVLLGGLDRDRVEALLDRAAALVGGEDALARRDERLGGGGKRGDVHVTASLLDALSYGYRPMPMPWARWSALPSVCSDGATMTSAFWNSLSVS